MYFCSCKATALSSEKYLSGFTRKSFNGQLNVEKHRYTRLGTQCRDTRHGAKDVVPVERVEPEHQAKQSPFARGLELVPEPGIEPRAYWLKVRVTIDIKASLSIAIFTNIPENTPG